MIKFMRFYNFLPSRRFYFSSIFYTIKSCDFYVVLGNVARN